MPVFDGMIVPDWRDTLHRFYIKYKFVLHKIVDLNRIIWIIFTFHLQNDEK